MVYLRNAWYQAGWTDENVEPNPIFKAAEPTLEAVDTWVQMEWGAPAVMLLNAGVCARRKLAKFIAAEG